MKYQVIHLVDASRSLSDLEYSQMTERYEQLRACLLGDENCEEQIRILFSGKAEIVEHKALFERNTTKKGNAAEDGYESNLQPALELAAEQMRRAANRHTVLVLYTDGWITDAYPLYLDEWKRRMEKIPHILLALVPQKANGQFLRWYTDPELVFPPSLMRREVNWFRAFGIQSRF